MRIMLKSKIHYAIVTEADVNYFGSLGIPSNLMKEANILPYEKILVVNLNNGSRAETYAIETEEGSNKFTLNGGLARLGKVDDKILILSFGIYNDSELKNHKPKLIFLNK